MATILSTRPATASPLLPLHAHTSNHASADPPVPLGQMSQLPGARYQPLPQADDSRRDQEESSPVSEATLTPSSTEDHEQTPATPGHRLVVPPWNRFTTLLQNPFTSNPRLVADKSPNDDKKSVKVKSRHEKLEDFELGYPRLGALIDSDKSFCMFRRYGATAARIILQRQIELGELVKELHKLDKTGAGPDRDVDRLITVKHNDSAHQDLTNKIEDKLLKFYDLLLKYLEVKTLRQPPKRDQLSVYNWIQNNTPIVEEEADFVFYIEDLISGKNKIASSGQPGNKVEDMLDWLSSKHPRSFLDTLLRNKSERMKTDDPNIHIHSSERLGIIGRVIIVFLAVNFLLIPVFLLFLVQMSRPAMSLTVMGFVLGFSMVLATLGQAKVQEILIGTAAYGAFLVTFLGNMNSDCPLGMRAQ